MRSSSPICWRSPPVSAPILKAFWLARVFYVWLSVFNLFVISVAWSLMADVFRPEQARRLFALIAAGASAGGLLGPMLAGLLVGIIGHAGLSLLAAGLLGLSLLGVGILLRWRARAGAGMESGTEDPQRPIGGGIFAGLSRIARSPYLLGISAFVVLLAAASTFLYFEQARLVAESFPDRVRQTQVFSALDAVVQALTIFTQIFLTGRLAARRGVTVLLTAVPVVITGGLLFLAYMPVFGVLAAVMVLRRVGEYALVRPGREMLFTVVDAETKYKAKNVIDTLVYRGGDAVSGWVKAGIDALGFGAWPAALVGAALAAVLGRRRLLARPLARCEVAGVLLHACVKQKPGILVGSHRGRLWEAGPDGEVVHLIVRKLEDRMATIPPPIRLSSLSE